MRDVLTPPSAVPIEQVATPVPILDGYKDLLSTRDLSEIFQVSQQTVYKEMKEGKFGTPIIIGRAYKVPKIYILQRYFHGY